MEQWTGRNKKERVAARSHILIKLASIKNALKDKKSIILFYQMGRFVYKVHIGGGIWEPIKQISQEALRLLKTRTIT